ncbi:hypothetical protein M430DRAFT_206685 [Amorphotheca resinae ATCC 22711]|uniref:Uncharacterized protein n=1 Tax=Amorphotheca resinae ATCC 22711 TaxID=857342 RepID=A0A2T3BBT5_AMORE|nr:hypothetical protein M430DRAFT_206685 [Amorphotheca resinae ATCC 22711]PSS25782.1 hypothetical protein M430DRAFT_206685 [Amorphotheca resinae ATCC 22711]
MSSHHSRKCKPKNHISSTQLYRYSSTGGLVGACFRSHNHISKTTNLSTQGDGGGGGHRVLAPLAVSSAGGCCQEGR